MERSMLSSSENELITRVEGDAPLGRMMRRYWLPACLSEELPAAGGAPVPVRVLGEDLVARRDASGRVRAGAYPVREAGDMVWAYLGPAEHEPPFPAFDFLQVPSEQRAIVKIGQRTNYLQAVEGAIDSAHSWFLHRGTARDWARRNEVSSDTAPQLEAEDTDYGFRYAAIRKPNADPDGSRYVRVTNYVLPTTALIPRPLDPDQHTHVQIFVPVDDENTMFYGLYISQDGRAVSAPAMREKMGGRPGVDLDARWFKRSGAANWFAQDRAAMKAGDWSGIHGIPNQDMACQESMGPIVDRTGEHLGSSDIAIIRMRRRMLESIRRFIDGGTPIGLDATLPYGRIRSEQKIVPVDQPWQSVGAYAGEYTPASAVLS
jgi:phthalate 4,5-dioxygenase oxygenase subunit